MPILGISVIQTAEAVECERCVLDAIQTGYPPTDTASSHMMDEAVGRGIRRAGVGREDLFVTGKRAPAVIPVEVKPFLQRIESTTLMKEQGLQAQAWATIA